MILGKCARELWKLLQVMAATSFSRDTVPARLDEDRSGAKLDRESQEYFRRREEAERQAAKHAASEQARRAHEELAQEYAALLSRT